MKRLSAIAREGEVITVVHDVQWVPWSIKK
jgi:hypothetical protein